MCTEPLGVEEMHLSYQLTAVAFDLGLLIHTLIHHLVSHSHQVINFSMCEDPALVFSCLHWELELNFEETAAKLEKDDFHFWCLVEL